MSERYLSNSSRGIGLVLTLLWCSCGYGQVIDDSTVAAADQLEEFCQLETMKGRCRWKSEVIVMTSARWGRMKTGRCLDIHQNALTALGHDPLFLGCSADVLSLVDRKCSGRSQCDIRIPDNDLDKITPCYPDQTRFLETSYTCVKVVQESRSCSAIVTNDEQYISSTLSLSEASSASTCGSRSHPWRLDAPAGQRINISLLDFNGFLAATQRDTHTCQRQYGYVVEKSNKKNVSICSSSVSMAESTVTGITQSGARLQRDSAVYLSETNSLNIVLLDGTNVDNYNFLLKIHAVGCTNMVPPDNAWLKRHNNDIVIGCYLSQQTWQLKCDGHEWKGQFGTCPDTYIASNENRGKPLHTVEPIEDSRTLLAMIVIGGGAIIVCTVVIATGIVCLQRCKRTYKKTQNQSTLETSNLVMQVDGTNNRCTTMS